MKYTSTISAALLSASVLALANPAYAQDGDVEEIVVTGIRSSLKAAQDLKRADSRIIDAIVAEDIGKLPDNNIAEALQRVTGVTINRDYGVGNAVSIRGTNKNRVEINGRSTLGDSRNGISFEDMPSAFVKALEVVKSPTPEMIEGALGGTINMKTIRPLDLRKPTIAGSIDLEYADKTENIAPIMNVTAGKNWDMANGGSFGVVASLSYQERELRQDTFQNDLRVLDGSAIDINNDGNFDAADRSQVTPSGNYVFSREHKFEPWTETRERTAANVSLQYAPNDRGDVYLDLNFTERDGGEQAYSVLSVGGSPNNNGGQAYEDQNGQLVDYALDGVFAIPKTWSEFRKTKSFSHALGGNYDITDKLNISAEYATAESDSKDPKSELNWRAHDTAAEALNPSAQNLFQVTAIVDTSSTDKVPGLTFVGQPDLFVDQDKLALREFRYLTDNVTNEEDALRFDAEYSNPFDFEWFTALKAGYRTTDRGYEKSSAEFRSPNLHQDLTKDGDFEVVLMSEWNALFPGTLITPFSPGDIFDQAGYASRNQTVPYTLYDAGRLSNDLEGTFDSIKQVLAGTNREVSGTLQSNLAPRDSSFSGIDETTDAFYVQADLDFDYARIVLGARQVETEVTASAFQDGELVSDTETYDDLLPSINISVDLNENTVLRAAGAKVMRRADFGQLSPAYNLNGDLVAATRGNPGLEPFRATQFDFGAEHYWGENNFLSATVFYKDVQSFLVQTQVCSYLPDVVGIDVNGETPQNISIPSQICILPPGPLGDSATFTSSNANDPADPGFQALLAAGRNGVITTTNTNGSSGFIKGFEIGTVYNFDWAPGFWSGFGINANYTFSDSGDPDGFALEDISKHSSNIQVFWEDEKFGARLAYSNRSRFLEATRNKRTEHIGTQVISNDIDFDADPTQGNSFRDGIKQLDASVSWNVNEWLTLVGYGTNLTGESITNTSVTGTTWQIQESDRRFTLGARATF